MSSNKFNSQKRSQILNILTDMNHKEIYRFTSKALDQRDLETDRILLDFKEKGLLKSVKIVRCEECGSDLGHYANQEELFCPACQGYVEIFEDMIEDLFFITIKGQKYFVKDKLLEEKIND